ncbi:MAG: hypothetical protein GY729_03920 [Desulfobacteraceae bacterium]|nr:hypothetical protein [Desulfobacteraceae bacterium]
MAAIEFACYDVLISKIFKYEYEMDSLLSKTIASIKKQKRTVIVAICGAADLGKSYLSKKVVKNLNAKEISANHLSLDSFLVERPERLEKGLSGYEIEAYEQELALDALCNFKKRQPIVYAPYVHGTGKRSSSLKTLQPGSVLIFEGVQSMHEIFLPYIDFSIFIYTKDELLKKIRYEADLVKRNYTMDFAKQNSESEFAQYIKQLSPYKMQADLLLFLEKKWEYRIQSQPV